MNLKMRNSVTSKCLFIFLSLLLIPLPAIAHGGELNFFGPQLMQYFALLLVTIILATPGNRWMSFFVVLMLYPVVFIVLGIMVLYVSSIPVQALVYMMYAVWGLSLVALIQMRIMHKAKLVAKPESV